MNKFDIKEIIRNTIDGDTYPKAYELYTNKKVVLQCHRNELDEDVYEGIVTGMTNKSYPVLAKVNLQGKVTHATCECDYYLNYEGYCKHIVAFFLKINEITTNRKEVNQLSSLLDYYKKSTCLDVHLTPIFHIYQNEVGVELKIHKTKTYFVKNIQDFYDNIDNHLSFKYGKDLEFVHNISAFDKESRVLIMDLKDYINYKQKENSGYFDSKRKILLPNIVFKKCFDSHLGNKVNLVLNEANYELEYTGEDFDLDLLFDKNTLSIRNKKEMRLFWVGRSYYVIRGQKLYCLDNVHNPQLVPLVVSLFQQDIVFTSQMYNQFFTYIYPQIENCITIVNKEEFEKHNNCSNLEAEVYLDFDDGYLELSYKFLYHSLEREEAIKQGYFPNEAQEETFFDELLTLNFLKTTRENVYVIEDENDAFDFLNHDIPKLKEIAKVYVSNSIKRLNFKTITSPGVVVRYKNNWLELVFNENIVAINDLEEILAAMKKHKKYHLLKDGTILNLEDEYLTEMKDIVETIGVPVKDLKPEMQIPLFKMIRIENLLDSKYIPKEVTAFLNGLKTYKNKKYPLNNQLTNILRDYQKEGFSWLYNLAYYKAGGILADDMGLGKSLQIIALLSSFKTNLPSLIVSPSSLTYNWYNEFNKWHQNANVVLITGNGMNREKLIRSIEKNQIIITSYDYLKRDIELYKNLKFHFMIIDEAQNIKNFMTKNAESVKSISAITKFAVTGTPLENTLADLWSIFDYCLPGYLKTYDLFKEEYEYDIIRFNDQSKMNHLNKLMAPFILRRTKKEVLKELPEKTEQVIYAQMETEQLDMYTKTIESIKKEITETHSTNRTLILSMLTRLRQICCHPSLYQNDYQGESAKLNLTLELVESSISSDHKILIFSQFATMLSILEKHLKERNIKTFMFTGATPNEKRADLIEEFNKNEGIKVFLITLKAGGTGINLTSADTVIHYDPWWNFSAENQASDRVHRIGQKRNVQIFKLITKDSVEEKILNLQMKKKNLFDKVISNDSDFLSSLSIEDLLALLTE